MTRRRVEVSRRIAANPTDVFNLLVTLSRHGGIDGSGMVLAVDSGPNRLELGSRFTMKMVQMGWRYTSVSRVVELQTDILLTWESFGELRGRRVVGGQRWQYLLKELPDGATNVTHSYLWGYAKAPLLTVWLWGYPHRMRGAMSATLDALDTELRSPTREVGAEGSPKPG